MSLDPNDAPRERPERPIRAGRSTSDGAQRPAASEASAARTQATIDRQEKSLADRLLEAITRIAVALDNRSDGNSEMADALRRNGKAMADSTVNFTRKVKVLRGPLLWVLSMVEPVLAFGEVVGIAFRKFTGWRGRGTEEKTSE